MPWKPIAAAILALGVYSAAGSAAAHHSYAMFDTSKTLDIAATVEKWEWTNPHTFLEVVETGNGKRWSLEAASPSMLSRQGMNRASFKPGDKVLVKLHPRRDNTPIGSLMSVSLTDGKILQFEGRREQPGGN